MTSKEALDILVGIAGYHAQYLDKEEIKEYNEALSHYEDITNGLETLEKLEAKTHLLFKDRKTISKEFDKWCVDNNVLNCSENMTTWFLTIKLKEWLENDK